ncbi:sporulation protein [Clostridium aceticum]|uniref:Sporulation protein n=1 Tax=Clostridium aceticum TaxID=84022 RepID=A0A0D8IAD6_9CLOT|nr:sporulation protein YabP [Clostridium aceticum]AKL93634.1 sporulation protein [Clostridium aceticum]KJF27255.1 spore coat protein [Clostridium aceticum]
MEERKTNRIKGHSLILENREKLSVSGVEHVNTFNSELIVVETIAGVITIKGEELDVKKLNLEEGQVSITGTVHAMTYSSRDSLTAKSSGFFNKIFK